MFLADVHLQTRVPQNILNYQVGFLRPLVSTGAISSRLQPKDTDTFPTVRCCRLDLVCIQQTGL